MASRKRKYTFELSSCDPATAAMVKRKAINPFTREPMVLEVHKGWSPERRAEVDALLERRGSERDDCGFNVVTFPDRSKVQISFGYHGNGAEESEVNIICKDLTEEVAGFVLDVIRAANMAMIPNPTKGVPVAAPIPPTDPGLKKLWPDLVVVDTPREMIDWLEKVGHRNAR